jgi:lipocalin
MNTETIITQIPKKKTNQQKITGTAYTTWQPSSQNLKLIFFRLFKFIL